MVHFVYLLILVILGVLVVIGAMIAYHALLREQHFQIQAAVAKLTGKGNYQNFAASQNHLNLNTILDDQKALVVYNRVPKTGPTSFVNVAYDLHSRYTFRVLHVNITGNSHLLSIYDQYRFVDNTTNWIRPAFYHDHFAYIDFERCSLWLYYGMILANSTLVSVNAFGSLLFVTYLWIYYKYTSKKKRVIHYMIIAVAVIIWIVYITYASVQQKPTKGVQSSVYHKEIVETAAVTPSEPKQPDPATISTNTNDAIDRVGFLCCLTTMLFFAAPLSNLVHVIRTRNTESMPLPMIVMTFLVSAQWLVYGRMLRDKFIMYPNAVGCLFSVVQLTIRCVPKEVFCGFD